MNDNGLHPLLTSLVSCYFSKLNENELQKIKEEVNKRIDDGNHVTYWREVRVKISEEIQRRESIKSQRKLNEKSPFEVICNEPLQRMQQVVDKYTFINSKDKTLIPQVHCRVNLIQPKTRYSTATGKTNEITDGYEITILYPNFHGRVNYRIEETDNKNFCKLIITSNSQYKDVEFIIENKRIEMSQRRGYSCYFDKELFHLKFFFKRDFQEID
ncbi:hypothetical protein ENUP19_0056G0012 [Entamoeba nuttalli]|uniref:Splicing factor Cactin C-terminal domain-containing protein n=3 Tax=Entamoeba nuttalli TaxID=412467 RepID=K2HH37_ENTNP|nr:hypothetical protein ENU1_028170 [Entamoeba nuttalli P19]EKE42224.1 hypothetical protein ENU1_028170 [Entamoeba nuttalli P19]|eukprot:XP_008855442.1 hypothetical protein ENU1_028170 [Entamoeba nuttalli P19]